jgi:hypothetical protein
MTFKHGTSARFYYHTLNYSDFIEEADPSFERQLAEYAALTSTWKGNVAGTRSFSISLGGLFDSTVGDIDDISWTALGDSTARPFAYLPSGDTLGSIAYCGNKLASSAQVIAADDVIKMPVAAIATNACWRCEILHPLGEETTTSQDTSRDGSAASNYGAVAYLICTAYSGLTDITVSLEHSDDDISYSTLVSFTALTDVGSESKTVAAGAGSVKRYVRAAWTVTGTGTATFFVAWYRKTS